MVRAHVGQTVDLVHLLLRERHGRRILHDTPLIVLLQELPAADRVLLEVLDLERLRKGLLVLADSLEGRQLDVVPGVILVGHAVAGAVDVLDVRDLDALLQVGGDLEDGALAHAIDQQVGLAVDEDGAADGIRPVIVMRHAAQARLDAADDDRHIGIELAQAIAVDDCRALRPVAGLAARRIRVLMADFLGRVNLLSSESMLPAETRKPSRGLPRRSKSLVVCQSGCGMMPTL